MGGIGVYFDDLGLFPQRGQRKEPGASLGSNEVGNSSLGPGKSSHAFFLEELPDPLAYLGFAFHRLLSYRIGGGGIQWRSGVIGFCFALVSAWYKILPMNDFVVVYVTVGSSEEGERLARALVEERLAACVNRIRPVRSIYRWQGKVEESDEELMILKTKRELFGQLKKRIRELHSYSVPEIIALPVLEGDEAYLRWLDGEVRKPK